MVISDGYKVILSHTHEQSIGKVPIPTLYEGANEVRSLVATQGHTCRILNMLVYGAMRIKKWQTIMDLPSKTRYTPKSNQNESRAVRAKMSTVVKRLLPDAFQVFVTIPGDLTTLWGQCPHRL